MELFVGFNGKNTKQGWKLSKNSNAIVTQVLKAKYFQHSGFLDAPLGHNQSYT